MEGLCGAGRAVGYRAVRGVGLALRVQYNEVPGCSATPGHGPFSRSGPLFWGGCFV